MIVNEVDVLKPERDLPRLPVARAVWAPNPELSKIAELESSATERMI